MSEVTQAVHKDVAIPNSQGLHARPVMRFVQTASQFQSKVFVTNLTRGQERVDGKSPMQMMLLDASKGCILRIEATGDDAGTALVALVSLVESGFQDDH